MGELYLRDATKNVQHDCENGRRRRMAVLELGTSFPGALAPYISADFGVSWDAFWSPFRGLSRLISADFGVSWEAFWRPFRGISCLISADSGVSWDAFWSRFRGLSRLISADFGADLGLLVVACCLLYFKWFFRPTAGGTNRAYYGDWRVENAYFEASVLWRFGSEFRCFLRPSYYGD